MKVNPLTCPKLTVSEDTARFIGCISTMQNLYSEVYGALETLYNVEACEELINTQFYDEFKVLEQKIQEFLMMSIKEKIGALNQAEI